MKVEVEQWVRRNDDRIFMVTPTLCLTHSDWKSKKYGYMNDVIKVSNTPQELIQKGDLVFIKDTIQPHLLQRDIEDFEIDFVIKNVIEIWTKIDDDTYKRQWNNN